MIRDYLRKFPFYQRLSAMKSMMREYLPLKSELGGCGVNAILEYPVRFEHPQSVFLEENVKIRSGCRIINSPTEKVIVKKYSTIAACCTIITNTHKSVATVPAILLGASHISDKSTNIIIEEDVWIGAGVTLLPGAHLCRGCIVGAGAIVSKNVPPYAVVVGAPARIILKKFELDDILKHETSLYSENERMSREELENIFCTYFEGLKTFGSAKHITDEDREKINKYKHHINFVEPVISID